ncbi:hypothetical protein FJR11_19880 [Anabaena sp. UHCC 0187]|uniref:hypothetical protein n=1 Tax=Anabaena sp. UHCC 0187 TaxID=2590018 RepID=UPI00144551D3|nr:hypothetical protein [Anabaena sp. UHCC 0187]MTJ14793.1 hypothetical protein [Anabaena sp. UHCC 0187]
MKPVLKTKKLVLPQAQQSLFILGLSLFTLGASELSVLAAPAPIFKPVINQIKQHLPNNLVFRLPSSLPKSITQGISKDNLKVVFNVNDLNADISLLNTSKYCQNMNTGDRLYAINCIRISINAVLVSSKYYKNFQDDSGLTTPLTLNKNIKAFLFKGDGWNNITWFQNGTLFLVSSGSCSESKLITIANSMINETPIKRTR